MLIKTELHALARAVMGRRDLAPTEARMAVVGRLFEHAEREPAMPASILPEARAAVVLRYITGAISDAEMLARTLTAGPLADRLNTAMRAAGKYGDGAQLRLAQVLGLTPDYTRPDLTATCLDDGSASIAQIVTVGTFHRLAA
jgi:hypothetical protein